MPIPDDIDDVPALLDLYAAVPMELAAAVAGLNDEQLTHKPNPAWGAGAWTAAQVVQHVTDADFVFDHRLRRTIAEEKPALSYWEEDQFAANLDYDTADIAVTLALLDLTHRRTLSLLQRLDEAQWQRTGTHPVNGPMTVQQILHHAAHHVRHHAEILAKKREHLLRS